MKIEEKAINLIQCQFKCGIDYTEDKDVTAIAILHGEPAEAIIRALEKQIPQKVEIDKPHMPRICPKCKHGMISHNDKYCWNCGQALEWVD